jgi:hypothetical protein
VLTQSGTSDGCYGGAGWVIGNDIFFIAQTYNSNSNDFLGNADSVSKTTKLIERAVEACRSGFNINKNKSDPSHCISLMLNRMPLFWYMNPDELIDNCLKLKDKIPSSPMYDLFLNCLAGGFEHVNKDDMNYIVNKYPKLLEILKSRYPLSADVIKPI